MTRYFFHSILGELLPVIDCEISISCATLYEETLGISSEEAQEMVRIQNVSPDERTLSDWQFLEEMNKRALKLN